MLPVGTSTISFKILDGNFIILGITKRTINDICEKSTNMSRIFGDEESWGIKANGKRTKDALKEEKTS